MITFLEYQNIEDIYHHIITSHHLESDSIFTITDCIDKTSIVEWSALNQLGSDSIFDEGKKIQLVDISQLNISSRINSINTDTSIDLYLYNPDIRKLNVGDKKILTSSGINYHKVVSMDKETIKHYIDASPLSVDNKTFEHIYQNYPTLFGIYNCLETLQLIDPQNYLKSIEQIEQVPLYKQSVYPGNKKNISMWYNQINEDEIQLNISLLHTKLKKNPANQKHLFDLIQLDERIKTHSSTKPSIWYKYFLWQLTQA